MPKIFEIYGFSVSIWSNENGEPIHVHVSKGRITRNSPKFWLSRHGYFVPANDCSRYFKAKELTRIIEQLNCNAGTIRLFWLNYHGYESYYC